MQIKQKHQQMIIISLFTALALSIAAIWLSASNTSSQKWGTVDMQALLQMQSLQLAKSYPNGSVPPGVMQQVIEDIKTVINDFGQAQKITILAKAAVLSGEHPDYTQEILNKSARSQK